MAATFTSERGTIFLRSRLTMGRGGQSEMLVEQQKSWDDWRETNCSCIQTLTCFCLLYTFSSNLFYTISYSRFSSSLSNLPFMAISSDIVPQQFLPKCGLANWPHSPGYTVTVSLVVSAHKDHELEEKERQRANLHLIKHTILRCSRCTDVRKMGHYICERGAAVFPLSPFLCLYKVNCQGDNEETQSWGHHRLHSAWLIIDCNMATQNSSSRTPHRDGVAYMWLSPWFCAFMMCNYWFRQKILTAQNKGVSLKTNWAGPIEFDCFKKHTKQDKTWCDESKGLASA